MVQYIIINLYLSSFYLQIDLMFYIRYLRSTSKTIHHKIQDISFSGGDCPVQVGRRSV